jgi:hypothetical protein
LIILFCGPKTWVGKLLGSAPFVGIGLISYSAYLWHQPVFAFTRLSMLREPSVVLALGLIALVLALSFLSWRWVEEPFRRRRIAPQFTPAHALAAGGLSAAAVVAIAALGLVFPVAESNLSPKQRYYASYISYDETENWNKISRADECFYSAADGGTFSGSYEPSSCLDVSTTTPNLLLMGDSFGAHLWLGIHENFPDFNVMQATAAGCKPLRPYMGHPACIDLVRFVFEEFLPNERVDGVILAARWRPEDLERLSETITFLREMDVMPVVVGVMPEFERDLPEILAFAPSDQGLWAEWIARFVVEERLEFERKVESAAADAAVYVSMMSCMRNGSGWRVLSASGEPTIFDHGHFTLSGTREAGACLAEAYASVIQDELARVNEMMAAE